MASQMGKKIVVPEGLGSRAHGSRRDCTAEGALQRQAFSLAKPGTGIAKLTNGSALCRVWVEREEKWKSIRQKTANLD